MNELYTRVRKNYNLPPDSILMKFYTAPLLVTLASLQIASAASYTNYSSIAVAGTSYSGYNVAKFDTSLGTLTGVQVTVPISELQGSALVTNPTLGTVSINNFDSTYYVYGSSGSLGYTGQVVGIGFSGVSTLPDWNTSTIAPSASQPVSIVSGQSYAVTPETITSGYFAAYSGSGNVTFEIKNNFTITTTGAAYTVDTSGAGANSQVAVTYTYTPIPEPSAALLGGLGMLGLIRRRR